MFELIITAVLLTLGYFVGSHREKSHYQSIYQREKKLNNILLFSTKMPPQDMNPVGGNLVQGHVVVSVDYFKRFVAGLRKLVGGKLTSYESLLDRGRREAILRMKEQAREQNANMIFNLKVETCSISKGQGGSMGSVEVIAYGSAVKTDNVV